MRDTLRKTFARFRKDEKGVTLVEYGIAIILALTVGGTLILNGLGGAINDQLTLGQTCMTTLGGTCE